MAENAQSEFVVAGDVTIMNMKGKLDALTSPSIEKSLFELISKGRGKIILDLSEITYVSSAGLRMLLSVKKQLKSVSGQLVVSGLRPEVLDIMKICGFDHVLEIAKNKDEAQRLFKQ